MSLNRIRAIIAKDVKAITSSKQTLIPMIIVPLMMIVVMPLILILSISAGDLSELDSMAGLLALPEGVGGVEIIQIALDFVANYALLPFFLLVPVMTSSIMAALSFTGEKEKKTLESLLYTPITERELFVSKILASFIPAIVTAAAGFVICGVTVNLAGWGVMGRLFFPGITWLPFMLLMVPSFSFLAIAIMVVVSAKARTYQDAQQYSLFVMLPVIGLLIAQMTGLFLMGVLVIIAVSAAVVVISAALIYLASKKFTRQSLLGSVNAPSPIKIKKSGFMKI